MLVFVYASVIINKHNVYTAYVTKDDGGMQSRLSRFKKNMQNSKVRPIVSQLQNKGLPTIQPTFHYLN